MVVVWFTNRTNIFGSVSLKKLATRLTTKREPMGSRG